MPPIDDAALAVIKRGMAQVLIKSKLDLSDGVMSLGAFLADLRWQRGASPAGIAGLWASLLGKPPEGHRIELEISFPFCRSRCAYCMFPTRVPADSGELDAYIREVGRELSFFARPFSGVPLSGLLLGHGTPSLLCPRRLEKLMAHLEPFQFKPKAKLSIEANPASADRAKIRRMRRLGFNRISFGVESADQKVLRSIGRGYQDLRHVADCVAWSYEAGFQEVNVDLVLGLACDSVESFLGSFRACLELRPTTIAVCLLTPTDRYLRATGESRQDCAQRLESWLPRVMAAVRELSSSSGYGAAGVRPELEMWTITAPHAPPPPAGADLQRPLSVLGVGHGARSHI
ncbi:MAG: radical SAM protein, partial [Elusimicrobiota bacterium]